MVGIDSAISVVHRLLSVQHTYFSSTMEKHSEVRLRTERPMHSDPKYVKSWVNSFRFYASVEFSQDIAHAIVWIGSGISK